MGPARLGANGAPPALPLLALYLGAFSLAALAAFAVMNPGLLTGPVSQPGLVALLHAFTLGFVGLIFAGTLQQLPAVMFVTKLAWPNLGYATTPLLVSGALLVVVGFAAGFRAPLLVTGAVLSSAAWLLLLAQLLATAARRWPKDAGSRALILSVALLTLTVLAGFLLAGVRSSPALARAAGYPVALHLTLGLFGAYLLGIVGSGQKLLAMFALSKGGVQWRVRAAAYAVGLAVAVEALKAFTALRFGAAPLLLLAAACLLQLLEVHALYRARLRRQLEAPIQRYVLAHAFLPLAGVALLAGEREAAVALFMIGFLGLAVSGMLVKITSFLVWTAAFAGGAGGVARGAPLLKDLMLDSLEPVTTATLTVAALLLAAAMVSRSQLVALTAAALLLIGALSQLVQVTHVIGKTLRAKRRLQRAATSGASPVSGAPATQEAP